MDDDVGPPHTELSPPAQQPPPALPSGTEPDQSSSPASASLGLSIASNATTALTPSASSTLTSDGTATLLPLPQPCLLSLSPELKAHILSFLPTREVARNCRAVCVELRDCVDNNKNQIARSRIEHQHADLQHRIDILTQMRPRDLASSISCFRYWVTQRGFARYIKKSAYGPFMDWVYLVSRRPGKWYSHQTPRRWWEATGNLVKLQEKISCSPATEHANILLQTRQEFKTQDEGEYAAYEALCELVARQAVSQPFFDFKFLEMTKTREHQTYPATRLTQATLVTGRYLQELDPCCPLASVAQLALPTLPAAMFCYYIEENEEWCRTALNRQGLLSLLEKAAILDVVKIY